MFIWRPLILPQKKHKTNEKPIINDCMHFRFFLRM